MSPFPRITNWGLFASSYRNVSTASVGQIVNTSKVYLFSSVACVDNSVLYLSFFVCVCVCFLGDIFM